MTTIIRLRITSTLVLLFILLMEVFTPSELKAQAVGIGSTSFTPGSMLSVDGGLSVGNAYRTTAAPTDGAIIKGNVGIGSASPANILDINFTNTTDPSSGGLQGISLTNLDNTGNSLGGVLFRSYDNGNVTRHSSAIVAGKESATAWVSGSGNYPGYLSFWTRPAGAAQSERMRIISTGNVGIGTTIPGDLLHIKKDQNTYGGAIIENTDPGSSAIAIFQVRNGTTLNDAMRFDVLGTGFTTTGAFTQDGGSISTGTNLSGGMSLVTRANAPMIFCTNGHTNERMRIDGAGNIGIGTSNPTYKLEVNGRVKSTGINESSDVRYKKDIKIISNPLEKIMHLRGVNYYWKTNEFKNNGFDSLQQMGLIAQEVEQFVPEVVRTDNNGYKSIEYSKLVALLIEGIKYQQGLIEQQQRLLNNIATENQHMKENMGLLSTDKNKPMLFTQ